jgi:hypothetical protein
MRRLFRKRLVALAAVLAIGLQALWPLIAQAKPRVPGERVPICTIAGVTHYLELPEVKTPLEQRSSTHGEHCQLCVLGSDKVVLQESRLFDPSPEEFSEARPSTAILDFESRHPPQGQPRAPPVAS